MPFPTSPSWGYRVTQGLHVITGTAAVPLLLVKLWTVFPRLFRSGRRAGRRQAGRSTRWSGPRSRVLVAAAIFQLATGLLELGAVVPVGLLVPRHPLRGRVDRDRRAGRAHRGEAADHPRRADQRRRVDTTYDRPTATEPERRCRGAGCSRTTWLAAGVAVLATAGSTVPFLRNVSVFGVRSGDGPGGIPINKSAKAAGVTATAVEPGVPPRRVVNGDRERLADAATTCSALTQRTRPCRSRASRAGAPAATWTGVRMRDLLDLVEAPAGSDVRGRLAAGVRRRSGTAMLQGELRRRRPHAAGAGAQRRAAVARPRLPGAGDRAQPARRAADQVGHPDRGAGVMRTAGRRRRARRRSSGRTAAGCCSAARTRDQLSTSAVWLAAGVVLHDVVLAPSSLVLGASRCRLLPRSRPGHRPSSGSWCSGR